MSYITTEWDTLVDQAAKTTDTYLGRVVRMLDQEFGDGYASQHPELVGRMVQTCAIDFGTAAICKTLGQLTQVIEHKDFKNGE